MLNLFTSRTLFRRLQIKSNLLIIPDATRKHELLEWVQSQIPSVRVSNLGSSWSDGVSLCALVDAVCPGSCPRYDLLKPNHKVNNCRLGLKLATKYLGIPQVFAMGEHILNITQNIKARQRKMIRSYPNYQC